MKNKKYILLPMLLALVVSCGQDELPTDAPKGDVVEVTAAIGSEAESRISQPEDNRYIFERDDKIHIVGWTGNWDDNNQPWYNDAVSTYDGTRWTTAPYMYWKYEDGNENLLHNFLAWWPENIIKSNEDLTAVDVTVTGDYKKDDILLAHWTGERPDDNNILELRFKHLLSRFDVHLFFCNEYTTFSDISIETNLRNKAVCDFLTGQVTTTSGEGVMMQERPHRDDNWDWSGTCITVPHEFIGELLTIKFVGNGEEKAINYEHTDRLNFGSGQRITLHLVVGKEKLELKDVFVTDWETAPEINAGEAEEIY